MEEQIIALVALTAMEIVLGIDNIVFIAIITGRLPPEQQPKARRLGLLLALGTRIALLCTLSWILGLTKPLFHISDIGLNVLASHPDSDAISVRDLILLGGGLFLIGKSVFEIHERFHEGDDADQAPRNITFASALVQIAILDIVFSLDSVITAVGMAEKLWVMITAVIFAVFVMLVFAESISKFVEDNPTLKVLALSFLILIGVMLTAESIDQHIEKGYIYFAMAFALVVEMINLRIRNTHRKHSTPPEAA